MQIVQWNADKRLRPAREPGMMVRVRETEALQIIRSLTNQILGRSCNSGRAEFLCEDGEYFSIAVLPDDEWRRRAQQKEGG